MFQSLFSQSVFYFLGVKSPVKKSAQQPPEVQPTLADLNPNKLVTAVNLKKLETAKAETSKVAFTKPPPTNTAPSTKVVAPKRKELDPKHDAWVPCNPSGKQKTPNQIRIEIRRFLARKEMTQKAWLASIGVKASSFNNFMQAGRYKNAWSAAQNPTYFAAARDLEIRRRAPKTKTTSKSKKRADPSAGETRTAKKQRLSQDLERISAVELSQDAVYDDCDIVRRKIRAFLRDSGVTKAAFLRSTTINHSSLDKFLSFKGKGKGAANSTYVKAYAFFERKRILEGKPKTKRRLESESRWGAGGYPLKHDDGKRWFHKDSPTDPRWFDIDWTQDQQNERRKNAGKLPPGLSFSG